MNTRPISTERTTVWKNRAIVRRGSRRITRTLRLTSVANCVHQDVGYERENMELQNLAKTFFFSKASSASISWRIGWFSHWDGRDSAIAALFLQISLDLRVTTANHTYRNFSHSWCTSSIRIAFCSSSSSLSIAMVWIAKSTPHRRRRVSPAML